MNGLADYESYDALGLAELVRKKEISPLDLVDGPAIRPNRDPSQSASRRNLALRQQLAVL